MLSPPAGGSEAKGKKKLVDVLFSAASAASVMAGLPSTGRIFLVCNNALNDCESDLIGISADLGSEAGLSNELLLLEEASTAMRVDLCPAHPSTAEDLVGLLSVAESFCVCVEALIEVSKMVFSWTCVRRL